MGCAGKPFRRFCFSSAKCYDVSAYSKFIVHFIAGCIFHIPVEGTSCNVGDGFYVFTFHLCRPVYGIYYSNMLFLGRSSTGLGFHPHLLCKPEMSYELLILSLCGHRYEEL